MKVLLFVNGFPDAQRPNNGNFNLRTATELAKRVDLTVVVPLAMRPGRPRLAVESREHMTVVRVAGPVIPRATCLTLRLYRRSLVSPLAPFLAGADIVHSVGTEFAGLLAGALRSNYRYLHVTQVINDLSNLTKPAFEEYPYLSMLRRNLHGIVCNSRTLEETARTYLPQVQFVKTAYRGTDLEVFAPESRGTEVRDGVGPIKFLYLGGLPPYPDRTYGVNTKGGVTLMEAWKLGEEQFRQNGSTLLFGGPSSTSDQAREWFGGLKYPEAVRLGGVVPPDEVPQHLRAAGVVLIPSLDEGCPNLAFEALACGRPVLASDIGALSEVVVHGECGWTAQAGNAKALKESMVDCARPETRAGLPAMEIAARKRAERLFDCRNYVRTLVESYETVGLDREKRDR